MEAVARRLTPFHPGLEEEDNFNYADSPTQQALAFFREDSPGNDPSDQPCELGLIQGSFGNPSNEKVKQLEEMLKQL